MAAFLSSDIPLCPLEGAPRPLEHWLTTFPLAAVVLDPYTHESSWILETARRILSHFKEADVRTTFVVAGTNIEGASKFLGPLSKEFFTLVDPDFHFTTAAAIQSLPAFIIIRQDRSILSSASGWNPDTWKAATSELANMTNWSHPEIPTSEDPAAYKGTTVPETNKNAQ